MRRKNKVNLYDDIHNYYEHLVLEKLIEMNLNKDKTGDYIADLSCLVLNKLPPRYIRYQVDLMFYLPESERVQMEMNVVQAIQSSREFLDAHCDARQRNES